MIGYFIFRFLQPRVSFSLYLQPRVSFSLYFNDKINHFSCFSSCEISLFYTYWSCSDRVSITDLRSLPVLVTHCDEQWPDEILDREFPSNSGSLKFPKTFEPTINPESNCVSSTFRVLKCGVIGVVGPRTPMFMVWTAIQKTKTVAQAPQEVDQKCSEIQPK